MPATVASGTIQNGYTLTVNRPANTEAGDLLVASVSSDGTGITLGAPGGWVLIGGQNATGRSVRSWYKIATNSEPATYTFTSSSTNAYRATMLRVVGAPTSNPILAAGFDGSGGASSFTVPGATGLPSSGALEIAVMTANSGSNFTFSTPSGWSSLGQAADSNAVHMPWRNVSGTTAASQQFTVSASAFSLAWGAIYVASGTVIDISRSITPSKDLVRGFSKLFTGSITPAGVVNTMRVVVRTFTRSITPTGDVVKSVGKLISAAITPWGGYAQTTSKLFTGSITISGISRRSPIRVFASSITPVASLVATNIGRLFGAPGVVDITVRLAGEIRARVRRR